ncbi:hypothetical protein [Thermaerobacillus caldiproteolyticus]
MTLNKVVVCQTANEQYGIPVENVISIEKMSYRPSFCKCLIIWSK